MDKEWREGLESSSLLMVVNVENERKKKDSVHKTTKFNNLFPSA